MQHQTTQTGHIIRIEKGEEIKEALKGFAKEHDIAGAHIVGLGAVEQATIGLFHPDRKEYEWNEMNKQLEITNLTGNIARQDGEVKLHIHITLADEDQNAYGGHLKEGIANPTCEIALVDHGTVLKRAHDPATDLDLLSL